MELTNTFQGTTNKTDRLIDALTGLSALTVVIYSVVACVQVLTISVGV